MNIKHAIRASILPLATLSAIAGAFYIGLHEKQILEFVRKTPREIARHGPIVAIGAVSFIYLFTKLVRCALACSRRAKHDMAAKAERACHERLEEKVRKLTAELSTAKTKLETEIENRPEDQRELHQRLQHLKCLYGLSKIVNHQEIPLDQIFQKTVRLIREAYRYPSAMSVRVIFNGIRYDTESFKKTEWSRRTPIKANDKNVGVIEVYHVGTSAEIGEEMFVKEEDDLLYAVAEWLGSIAERKRAEEKLRLFRNLIERSNDYIFAVDPRWGRILDVNTRACDSLGYTRRELLNMTTIMDIEEPSSGDASWPGQIAALRSKGDIVKEGKYRRKDGTSFFAETSLKLVTQEKQEYIIAIARDITERKRAEAKLKVAQDKLLETAREVGMAEVATGVLHNVGNVLNSVNVTAGSVQKRVRGMKISYLADVVKLFEDHSSDLAAFMADEQQGKKVPAFLAHLHKDLLEEQNRMLESLEALTKHVQHMADIIQLQQSHSKTKGLIGPASIKELIEDAIQINAESIAQYGVKVDFDIEDLPTLQLDRHKVLQILTNLISNAIYALSENPEGDRILTISAKKSESGFVRLRVSDNGMGILKENLTRIFEHGFTTKERGHGFGLHSAALSANEMNGSIKVHSDGPRCGAVFTVELPFKTQEATT
jgi:PAS domain S-box-containing protein